MANIGQISQNQIPFSERTDFLNRFEAETTGLFLDFFIGLFNTILYKRTENKKASFFFCKKIFNLDLAFTFHPQVSKYIEDCSKRATSLVLQNSVDGLELNLLTGTNVVVQRFILKFLGKWNWASGCLESESRSVLDSVRAGLKQILVRLNDPNVFLELPVPKNKVARFIITFGFGSSITLDTYGAIIDASFQEDPDTYNFPWSYPLKARGKDSGVSTGTSSRSSRCSIGSPSSTTSDTSATNHEVELQRHDYSNTYQYCCKDGSNLNQNYNLHTSCAGCDRRAPDFYQGRQQDLGAYINKINTSDGTLINTAQKSTHKPEIPSLFPVETAILARSLVLSLYILTYEGIRFDPREALTEQKSPTSGHDPRKSNKREEFVGHQSRVQAPRIHQTNGPRDVVYDSSRAGPSSIALSSSNEKAVSSGRSVNNLNEQIHTNKSNKSKMDPVRLLGCLNPLLDDTTGAIKSAKVIPTLLSLMSKFSKKMVSKCTFLNILNATPPDLLDTFFDKGGWSLLEKWLSEGIQSNSYRLIIEILGLLLRVPMNISRLKEGNLYELIKFLSTSKANRTNTIFYSFCMLIFPFNAIYAIADQDLQLVKVQAHMLDSFAITFNASRVCSAWDIIFNKEKLPTPPVKTGNLRSDSNLRIENKQMNSPVQREISAQVHPHLLKPVTETSTGLLNTKNTNMLRGTCQEVAASQRKDIRSLIPNSDVKSKAGGMSMNSTNNLGKTNLASELPVDLLDLSNLDLHSDLQEISAEYLADVLPSSGMDLPVSFDMNLFCEVNKAILAIQDPLEKPNEDESVKIPEKVTQVGPYVSSSEAVKETINTEDSSADCDIFPPEFSNSNWAENFVVSHEIEKEITETLSEMSDPSKRVRRKKIPFDSKLLMQPRIILEHLDLNKESTKYMLSKAGVSNESKQPDHVQISEVVEKSIPTTTATRSVTPVELERAEVPSNEQVLETNDDKAPEQNVTVLDSKETKIIKEGSQDPLAASMETNSKIIEKPVPTKLNQAEINLPNSEQPRKVVGTDDKPHTSPKVALSSQKSESKPINVGIEVSKDVQLSHNSKESKLVTKAVVPTYEDNDDDEIMILEIIESKGIKGSKNVNPIPSGAKSRRIRNFRTPLLGKSNKMPDFKQQASITTDTEPHSLNEKIILQKPLPEAVDKNSKASQNVLLNSKAAETNLPNENPQPNPEQAEKTPCEEVAIPEVLDSSEIKIDKECSKNEQVLLKAKLIEKRSPNKDNQSELNISDLEQTGNVTRADTKPQEVLNEEVVSQKRTQRRINKDNEIANDHLLRPKSINPSTSENILPNSVEVDETPKTSQPNIIPSELNKEQHKKNLPDSEETVVVAPLEILHTSSLNSSAVRQPVVLVEDVILKTKDSGEVVLKETLKKSEKVRKININTTEATVSVDAGSTSVVAKLEPESSNSIEKVDLVESEKSDEISTPGLDKEPLNTSPNSSSNLPTCWLKYVRIVRLKPEELENHTKQTTYKVEVQSDTRRSSRRRCPKLIFDATPIETRNRVQKSVSVSPSKPKDNPAPTVERVQKSTSVSPVKQKDNGLSKVETDQEIVPVSPAKPKDTAVLKLEVDQKSFSVPLPTSKGKTVSKTETQDLLKKEGVNPMPTITKEEAKVIVSFIPESVNAPNTLSAKVGQLDDLPVINKTIESKPFLDKTEKHLESKPFLDKTEKHLLESKIFLDKTEKHLESKPFLHKSELHLSEVKKSKITKNLIGLPVSAKKRKKHNFSVPSFELLEIRKSSAKEKEIRREKDKKALIDRRRKSKDSFGVDESLRRQVQKAKEVSISRTIALKKSAGLSPTTSAESRTKISTINTNEQGCSSKVVNSNEVLRDTEKSQPSLETKQEETSKKIIEQEETKSKLEQPLKLDTISLVSSSENIISTSIPSPTKTLKSASFIEMIGIPGAVDQCQVKPVTKIVQKQPTASSSATVAQGQNLAPSSQGHHLESSSQTQNLDSADANTSTEGETTEKIKSHPKVYSTKRSRSEGLLADMTKDEPVKLNDQPTTADHYSKKMRKEHRKKKALLLSDGKALEKVSSEVSLKVKDSSSCSTSGNTNKRKDESEKAAKDLEKEPLHKIKKFKNPIEEVDFLFRHNDVQESSAKKSKIQEYDKIAQNKNLTDKPSTSSKSSMSEKSKEDINKIKARKEKAELDYQLRMKMQQKNFQATIITDIDELPRPKFSQSTIITSSPSEPQFEPPVQLETKKKSAPPIRQSCVFDEILKTNALELGEMKHKKIAKRRNSLIRRQSLPKSSEPESSPYTPEENVDVSPIIDLEINDDSPKSDDAFKGILVIHKKKGVKKTVRWKNDSDLVKSHYFELDASERVNVTRKDFAQMQRLDMVEERKVLKSSTHVETTTGKETLWTPPRPIHFAPSHPCPVVNSKERIIQHQREQVVLGTIYFWTRDIPFSPAEPDPEPVVEKRNPTIIPNDSKRSTDSYHTLEIKSLSTVKLDVKSSPKPDKSTGSGARKHHSDERRDDDHKRRDKERSHSNKSSTEEVRHNRKEPSDKNFQRKERRDESLPAPSPSNEQRDSHRDKSKEGRKRTRFSDAAPVQQNPPAHQSIKRPSPAPTTFPRNNSERKKFHSMNRMDSSSLSWPDGSSIVRPHSSGLRIGNQSSSSSFNSDQANNSRPRQVMFPMHPNPLVPSNPIPFPITLPPPQLPYMFPAFGVPPPGPFQSLPPPPVFNHEPPPVFNHEPPPPGDTPRPQPVFSSQPPPPGDAAAGSS